MKQIAVQFGAGNIGRGFLAQLFHEAGFEVVFVDISAEIIQAINNRREYNISIVGETPVTIPISNIRAISGRDTESVALAIGEASVIATAVGANALKHIAPALAEGILLRQKRNATPINLLICENLHHADEYLRANIREHLPAEEAETLLENVGFVQTVVSRMVPLQTDAERQADPLSIRVEAYKHLPIDSSAIVGEFPKIPGIEPTARFEAYVERKLYVHNCAHAVLGYLGVENGLVYGFEALAAPNIRAVLSKVLEETGSALIKKHQFEPSEIHEHIVDLLQRFENRELGDTCRRLSRDPVRKLAPQDRLVGAARLCESCSIEPENLALVIAVALCYTDPDDPSATSLQRMRTILGDGETLRKVSGISPKEPLGVRILELINQKELDNV